jgi:SAM-dependent methyltransferase
MTHQSISGARAAASEPASRKQVDAASYDVAAPEFDRLSERFCGPLAMQLLDLAKLRDADKALDVGTGTGLVALRAAARVRSGSVVGIDHSPGMLAQASEKARQSGLEDVLSFQLMDAERLEFPDQSFDVVLSLYALGHFPEPLAAIKQMYRVLRPGGRLVLGVGAGPDLFSWSAIVEGARQAGDAISAARGRLLTAPHFLTRLMSEHGMASDGNPLPSSHQTPVHQMMREAGFTGLHRQWRGHCEELDPEGFWRLQVTYATTERIRLQRALPEAVAALREDFLNRCRSIEARHGRLIYRHAAMFHVASRS